MLVIATSPYIEEYKILRGGDAYGWRRTEDLRDERYEVRLAGEGGQGLILAGLILAEAAVIYDHKNACQTQSYGPEARGGASKSEVVIDNEPIDYPKVISADALLAMSQEACDKYYHDLKREGLLIVDSVNVQRVPTNRAYSAPITKIAEEATGVALRHVVGLACGGLDGGWYRVRRRGGVTAEPRAVTPS